jgi:S-adenosylmethionine:tRNA ribosyltransferase-isomerase
MDIEAQHLTALNSYDFFVSPGSIAQYPLAGRDNSRLLVRSRSKQIADQNFSQLAEILPKDSLLILNNTRVFSCRIFGKKSTGASIEIFLLEKPQGENYCECKALAKPAKKLKLGTTVYFDQKISAEVVDIAASKDSKTIRVRFNTSRAQLMEWLQCHGKTPLPPYIKRSLKDQQDPFDQESYQTIFAKDTGSVAAPTSGLHFTDRVFDTLAKKNIEIQYVTLHIGLGTFFPVKHKNIEEHAMHKENFLVPRKTLQAIIKAKSNKSKIVVVGTTSLRSLESLYLLSDKKEENMFDHCDEWLETDLFIYPKTNKKVYQPWAIDGLITNFHQPQSTLFMLICALVGNEEAHDLYRYALQQRYRFFSYGDACLLWL